MINRGRSSSVHWMLPNPWNFYLTKVTTCDLKTLHFFNDLGRNPNCFLFGWRSRHELTDSIEHDLKLVIIFLFQLVKLARHFPALEVRIRRSLTKLRMISTLTTTARFCATHWTTSPHLLSEGVRSISRVSMLLWTGHKL